MNFAQLLHALRVSPDPLPAGRKTQKEVESLVQQEQIDGTVDLCGLRDVLDHAF